MSIYFMGNNRNRIVVGRVDSETKAKFCLKFIVSSKDANAAGVKKCNILANTRKFYEY